MNVEHQWLEAEASEVERRMREVSATVDLRSPSARAAFEQQMSKLGRTLASLHHGMALLGGVDSADLQ